MLPKRKSVYPPLSWVPCDRTERIRRSRPRRLKHPASRYKKAQQNAVLFLYILTSSRNRSKSIKSLIGLYILLFLYTIFFLFFSSGFSGVFPQNFSESFALIFTIYFSYLFLKNYQKGKSSLSSFSGTYEDMCSNFTGRDHRPLSSRTCMVTCSGT